MDVLVEVQVLMWLLSENDVLPLSFDGYGNFGNLMWDDARHRMTVIDFAANAANPRAMHFLDLEVRDDDGKPVKPPPKRKPQSAPEGTTASASANAPPARSPRGGYRPVAKPGSSEVQ